MKRRNRFGLLCLVGALSLPVWAVFVATTEPNGQHEAPEEGTAAWNAMGVYEQGGAVYLGQGWFITAGQLGDEGTSVMFRGEAVEIDANSWTPVLISLELSADARMFRAEDPGALPAEGVALLDRELTLNERVYLIGPGRDVAETVTVEGEIRYYQAETSQMKWGVNRVSGFEPRHDGLGFRSSAFDTSLAYGDAQALEGDVGGGVFVRDETSGELFLAGLIIQAGLQKGIFGTYAFKAPTVDAEQSSRTRSVYLYPYHDQIHDVLVPREKTPWVWGVLFIGFVVWMVRVVRRSPVVK